mmetsp:Transcript_88636/g.185237  ORF Transcript_88636/g.185237 Transcript_88636/m.185237 type:complete len:717 (-) Transcript_88636:116-2266(-)
MISSSLAFLSPTNTRPASFYGGATSATSALQQLHSGAPVLASHLTAPASAASGASSLQLWSSVAAGSAALLLMGTKTWRRSSAAAGAARGRSKRARAAMAAASSQTGSAVAPQPRPQHQQGKVGGQNWQASASSYEEGHTAIAESLLEEPWAALADKVQNMQGSHVRGCSKGAKQVATVGPASSSPEMLEKLFLCGVDVFRLNFSHGEHSEKKELISRIRDLEMKYQRPIGILADMQGPKQRCGAFADENGVLLKSGQTFRFDLDSMPGDENRVQLPHPEILLALTTGKALLLDDGKIRMRVLRRGCTYQGEDLFLEEGEQPPVADLNTCKPFIECKVEVAGRLKARKGVNTPDVVLPISPITPKDREDIKFACRNDVDWIALSFVQRHQDIAELRSLTSSFCSEDQRQPKLLAKIEKPAAVQDLDEILKQSDGVMVARGDLGVEMNPEEVPFVQKTIISKALFWGVPVIVATQMLESMISNPAPTRAECSDIANAILDGCDGVMLSGESAVGSYPLECVEMQRRVISASEQQQRRAQSRGATSGSATGGWKPPATLSVLNPLMFVRENDAVIGSVLASAVTLAHGIGAKAIVCFTATGRSVEKLTQFRPSMPVVAVCPTMETARFLSLYRGVYATSDRETQVLAQQAEDENAIPSCRAIEVAWRVAADHALVSDPHEWVVVICRLPWFSYGPLNVIRVTNAFESGLADYLTTTTS